MVTLDFDDFALQPAADSILSHKNVELTLDLNFVAPGLVTKSDLFQLSTCELEMIEVNDGLGLEAPSQRADKLLMEPLLFHIVEEQPDPRL